MLSYSYCLCPFTGQSNLTFFCQEYKDSVWNTRCFGMQFVPLMMQKLLLPVSVKMKCEIKIQGAKQPDVD